MIGSDAGLLLARPLSPKTQAIRMTLSLPKLFVAFFALLACGCLPEQKRVASEVEGEVLTAESRILHGMAKLGRLVDLTAGKTEIEVHSADGTATLVLEAKQVDRDGEPRRVMAEIGPKGELFAFSDPIGEFPEGSVYLVSALQHVLSEHPRYPYDHLQVEVSQVRGRWEVMLRVMPPKPGSMLVVAITDEKTEIIMRGG
jgi:hypothetical protein